MRKQQRKPTKTSKPKRTPAKKPKRKSVKKIAISGMLDPKQMKKSGGYDEPGYIFAFDPDKRKILAFYDLPKKQSVFQMDVSIEKTRLHRLQIMWQCRAGTLLEQMKATISTLD
ncbi:MAG: hypothetical protein OEL81_05240 [Nitrosopumilus sp.]|nr:hypothetical protein [Nitrosopumilus sp.]MDH3385788.1 hypothetical protein [Nitrosopumilus sp.]